MALFTVKKFKPDFSDASKPQGMAVAICVQNGFRPMVVDKDRIEDAIKSLFLGATETVPQKAEPKGFMHAGVRPVAWAVFTPGKADVVEKKLSAHIDGLNAIHAYQR